MKINILIVDDIEENIFSLQVLLEDLEINNKEFNGINIFTATSGEEALSIAFKENIELILLDVRMPLLDGFEVAKYLKSNKRTSHIPIIFLTAEFKSEEFIQKGYKVGALDYFTKPIEKFQFLSKIRLYVNLFLSQKIQKRYFDHTLSNYMNIIDKHVISFDIDINNNITRASKALCEISKYNKEELLGKNSSILEGDKLQEEILKQIEDAKSKNTLWTGELKKKTKSNKEYWVKASLQATYDIEGKKIGYSIIEHDITDKKRVEKLSITDALTGLFNRRYFDKVAPKVISSAKRTESFLSFAMLDVDFFKKYNDTYGHQMGDEVLQKVAKVFTDLTKRLGDYCFRIGGEEFCIMYVTNDKEGAVALLQNIIKAVENLKIKHEKNEASKYVTISAGLICEKSKDAKDLHSLFYDADKLLYKAKENGRNQLTTN